VRLPCLTQNGPDACRASLRHLDKNTFVFVGDHRAAGLKCGNVRSVGRPGLEPGTNALKGRCSTD
jgi:hypothetical protein